MVKTAVIVLYSSNYGGSTISGRLVANALSDLGWKVHVIFGFDGPFVNIVSDEGFCVQVIKHRNWLRSSKPVSFTKHILDEKKAADGFIRAFATIDPDLVYVNSLVSLAPVVASKQLQIPVVWHIRELFSNTGGEMKCPSLIGRTLVRSIIRRLSSGIVVVSESVGRNVLGESWKDDSVVVGNAAGEEFFEIAYDREQIRRGFGLPIDDPVVGVPGTLRPVKGHTFFLHSVPEILKEIPSCHFVITGDGEMAYKNSLIALAQSLGISSRVHFVGTVDRMDHFYQACDAVCVPSLSESFGRTVVEAFASRVPVVGTRVNGLEEIIRSGQTGLLIPYGDTTGLAKSVVSLLQDYSLKERLVQNAYKDAIELFHESKYRQKIGAFAQQILFPNGGKLNGQ